MVREDTFNQAGAGQGNGSKHKALIFALLLTLHQPPLLQVVYNEGQVPAAGKDAPRQIAQTLRPHMIQGLKHGELAECKALFFQSNTGVGEGGAGSTFQLHIRAQGPLLRRGAFELVRHDPSEARREIYRKGGGGRKAERKGHESTVTSLPLRSLGSFAVFY